MKPITFSRTMPTLSGGIVQPTNDEVRDTPSLFRASVDDALRYGGRLTRAAIGAMDFHGGYKHIVVDTKVHMLMPGFYPAIPGWHTDGVPRPRPEGLGPGKGHPNIWLQEESRSPRYHLLVTGNGALTDFYVEPIDLLVPEAPDPELYKLVSEQMKEHDTPGNPRIWTVPSCRVVEWDWWALHTARAAELHEWRFLIRVTETDTLEPNKDLRDVIRTQQQVYVPEAFGW